MNFTTGLILMNSLYFSYDMCATLMRPNYNKHETDGQPPCASLTIDNIFQPTLIVHKLKNNYYKELDSS